MKSLPVRIGDSLILGGGHPLAVQTMCNTHTADVAKSLAQCRALATAGAELIRLTVPGPKEVEAIRIIRQTLRSEGITVPIVADIHFSSETAIAVAPHVDKVRINPGNFHPDHEQARAQFARLVAVCKEHGTALRIGLNHGSLGRYITDLYGNTPLAMAKAAMEWVGMCVEHGFERVVVSLKASNTLVMVEAYRRLAEMMEAEGHVFPLHVGVTEAGNGDSGRIKSCVGIWTLLSEGIGDTVRVSLTEDPAHEIPVGRYLADRLARTTASSMTALHLDGRRAVASYKAPSREKLLLDFACDFGKRLLDKELDEVSLQGTWTDDEGREQDIAASGLGAYLEDELMQACRRRFYKPEYIACPGCGRTMYDLESAFAQVKAATSHLSGMVIAVMGCIVNGPGEMADADWGYVGEGGGKVAIYKGKEPVLRHVPEEEAVGRLLALIEASKTA